MGDRLTQSMYVRSDSQSSGVSFFVDFSDKEKEAAEKLSSSKKMVHSMSREEADHALDELSEDMRLKSSLLLAQNLEQTKAFFKKLKGYVDFLSLPSYSKDELRQKRKMAENISRLMFEEEQKLKKGQSLSSMGELDKILLGKQFLNFHTNNNLDFFLPENILQNFKFKMKKLHLGYINRGFCIKLVSSERFFRLQNYRFI